jgi:DNA-binding NtrC family response regulator
LAEGIFESEIFGHVKGAFTGAATSRTGLIRTAEGGTLLLDEVSVLAASSQARLLTVVEDNSIRPLGSDKAVPVDVRFICVTNQHLPALVNAGHFREDLYYRCAQLVLRLPPVRDRPAEIPAIVHRLIWELLTDELRLSSGRSITLTANALAALRATHFPGNMRHLRNVLLRAIVETGGSVVDGHHISAAYADIPPVPAAAAVRRDGAPRQISPPERSHPLTPAAIESCLRATSWNKRKAAELLGVSRSTLYRKLHQYGMER